MWTDTLLTVNSQNPLIRTVDVRSIRSADLKVDRLMNLNVPIAPIIMRDGRAFDGPLTPRLLQAAAEGREGIARYLDAFPPVGISAWVDEDLSETTQAVMATAAREYFESHREEWVDAGTSFDEMMEVAVRAQASTDEFVEGWRAKATPIEEAMIFASDLSHTIEEVAREVLDSENLEIPRVDLQLMELTGSPMLVADPESIWDRAWVEVIDLLLIRGMRPAQCAWCHNWFPPKRRGQRHCPGVDCGERAARRDWDGTDYRRSYHKMYARLRRGTISRAEFAAWTQQNRPATRRGAS